MAASAVTGLIEFGLVKGKLTLHVLSLVPRGGGNLMPQWGSAAGAGCR